MAVTASFLAKTGTLSVFGDNLDNTITETRDAAGNILINGGAVNILGGHPTVANTAMTQIFGQGGNDTITLNEANGALPAAQIFGGNGNDQIRVAGKRTTVDAGPGDDLITAITSSGSGTVKCGPGNDTVMVSRFKGNAKRVKVAKDCEKKKKG